MSDFGFSFLMLVYSFNFFSKWKTRFSLIKKEKEKENKSYEENLAGLYSFISPVVCEE